MFRILLKETAQIVDKLYRMIRIKLMDGRSLEIPREEACELLPYSGAFASVLFKAPIAALYPYRGKLVPLLGPLPTFPTGQLPAEKRAWILILRESAQVIYGFPEFEEAVPETIVNAA
jgi:hypothetical protein